MMSQSTRQGLCQRLPRVVLLGSALVAGMGLGSTMEVAHASGPILDWLLGNRSPGPVPVGSPQYIGNPPYANYPGSGVLAPTFNSPPIYNNNAYNNTAYFGSNGLAANTYAMTPYQGVPAQSVPAPTTFATSPYVNGVPNTLGPAVSGIPQTQAAYLPTAGYASQWNRAPVTYYRPVTQLDPATGTTVTRMMPCTSYELQAQRVPMLTLHPTLGSQLQANRWPSLAAPSAGSTPVPSSMPMTTMNGLPTYGTSNRVPYAYSPNGWSNTAMMPGTQGVVPATGPSASYNASYPATTWPSPAAATAIPSGSMFPVPAYYSSPTNYPYPTTNGSVMGTPNGSVMPSGTFPTYPSVPNASVLPSANSNYPSTLPAPGWGAPATGYSGAPTTTYPPAPSTFGTNNGLYSTPGSNPLPGTGWTVVPGSSLQTTPLSTGALQTGPSSTTPGGAPSDPASQPSNINDEESMVKPSLDRTREGASKETNRPLFPLHSVTREPSAEDRVALPNANAPKATSPTPLEAPRVDGLNPIPAPIDLPEPQFSPGLLDPRDRTADARASQGKPSPAKPQLPVQWISAPSKSNSLRPSTAGR